MSRLFSTFPLTVTIAVLCVGVNAMPMHNVRRDRAVLAQAQLLGNVGRTENVIIGGSEITLLKVDLPDDSVAMPITLTFIDFDYPLNGGAFLPVGQLVAKVEYANGGMMGTVSRMDVSRGKIITVYGSMVRVSIQAFGAVPGGTRKVGVFASLGADSGPLADFRSTIQTVAAAAFTVQGIPASSHYLKVNSVQPLTVTFFDGASVPLFAFTTIANEKMDWFPIPQGLSEASQISVTNDGLVVADIAIYFSSEL